MIVGPTGGVTGPQPIQPSSTTQARKAYAPASSAPADEADISLHARLLKKLHELPPVRAEKVERATAEIASGSYESEAKIKAAVDKLLQDIL